MATESPRPFYFPAATSRPLRPPELTDQPARVPTGVPDFDYLTGGLPAGSVVLLFGAAGAGHQEFALTSAVHLMLRFDDPRLHQFYLGNAKGPFVFPDAVEYVSTSRSREQVMSELRGAFDGTYPSVLSRHLTFRDVSPAYFADTPVPPSWSSVPSALLSGAPAQTSPAEDPLRAVADAVEACGDNHLVILDSLTDLLVRRGVDDADVLTLTKGLRRRAKEWGGIVYLILSEGVAPPHVEQAVIDSVDGVLHFNWMSSPTHSHRQRAMLIEKFMPVLSRLPAEHQGRFVIRVNAKNGLVTTQYERV
ncbi:MAG TPA: RAD55 family ATPase [Thermoplasmata archaeon]|nr:RAD55 family ATPase [Thermoplasmata archaeon]